MTCLYEFRVFFIQAGLGFGRGFIAGCMVFCPLGRGFIRDFA